MTPSQATDMVFMALAIWREARGESQDAQIAVGHTILNRVNRPSWWGRSVMEVLFKKWQYSSLTDPKDRQLTTWPKDDTVWQQCLYVAENVLNGNFPNPVSGADSYHDISIPSPKWATDKMFVRKIGRLRFFNVDQDVEK